MTRFATTSAVLLGLAALILPGCGESHGADDAGGIDTGPPTDASLRDTPPTSDAPPDAIVLCGSERCDGDEVCCSGCPGEPVLGCFEGGCPPIACPTVWTTCEEALAGGTDGDACEFLGECREDEECCSRVVACEVGVLSVERECGPGCLACASSDDCAASEYCDFTGLGCGGPGTCLPRPTACDDDCPGVCSCDGTTYCNACSANADGASVARNSACEITECAPQDARGTGACALFLGYRWDGESCTGIGGCSCLGSDCEEIFDDIADCDAAYVGCLTDG